MKWLDSITDSTAMNLSKLQETVKSRGAWWAAVYGVADYNGSNYYSYIDIRGFEWEANDTVSFAKAHGNFEVIYE